MKKFLFTEKQNINSSRANVTIEAKDLKQAKRKASSMQYFCGTILTIESENGELLATKTSAGWR